MQGSILVAGHASGDVNFWEFRRVAWECVKSVQDVHVLPIVQARFVNFLPICAVDSGGTPRYLPFITLSDKPRACSFLLLSLDAACSGWPAM